MHKNIRAAIIRQDEAKPAICVEEFHPTSWHFLVAFHPIAPPLRPPPSSVINSRLFIIRSPRRRPGMRDFAEREIMEHRARGEDHSPLMPAARITLPHFSVNSTTNLPNSAGELAKGSAPKSTSRALNLGSASAALTSLLRIAMISGGVCAGAAMPSQLLAS